MKYFKPKSLTWLASAFPIVIGVFIASEPVHGLADWVTVARSITGNVHPSTLINAGLVGIGLRGAIE